jgi:hypothetical protein
MNRYEVSIDALEKPDKFNIYAENQYEARKEAAKLYKERHWQDQWTVQGIMDFAKIRVEKI